RGLGVAVLLALAVLPALPLAWQAVASDTIDPGRGFGSALRNSGVVALLVVAVSWLLGLPAGVLAALYEFPGRKFLLALAVLTLSDPGPGQILGLRTAAGEILIRFSAHYDFRLAGLQCLALSAVVFVLALPLALLAAPRLAGEMLARQSRGLDRIRHRLGSG